MEAGTAAEGEPQERAADHVGRHEASSTGSQWRVRHRGRGAELSRGAEDTSGEHRVHITNETANSIIIINQGNRPRTSAGRFARRFQVI